jgi:hypothetical protein
MSAQHRWAFFRAGGFDQVKLEKGADLLSLDKLDQTLWVALACPTGGLAIDARTLSLIDADGNGRIRAGELIEAVRFAAARLANPDDLLHGGPDLPLSAINPSTPEGKAVLAGARQILRNLGKPDAASITVEEASDSTRIFADTAFNGDGVITEKSAGDEALARLIREIGDCMGTVPDRSGKPGIASAQVEAFFKEARALAAWRKEGESDAAALLPLGPEGTASAEAAVAAVRAKVDDYFGRCRLAAFDARSEAPLNRREEEYLAIAAGEISLTAKEVASFPLARIAAGRPLPLQGPVNPAHAAALAALAEAAVKPLLGSRSALEEADWLALEARLAPYRAWMARKPAAQVEKSGRERLEAILAGEGEAAMGRLIAEDKALEAETSAIVDVEKLARYHRDLARLCSNFVNFRDFYDRSEPAIFLAGTLYLDQRACRLCIKVEDPAKHALMAGLAGAYLAYLECTRKGGGGEKMHIVAAFTAGDSDNLMVGRNGVFYDRQGRDWDATITKIVDNPISIRQAFWAPYKKFVRYIEEQVTKRAAAADAEADKTLSGAALTAVNVDKNAPKQPASKEARKIDVGTVAALGVAVGAIGTFFTAMAGYGAGIFRLGIFPTLGAVIGLVLIISTPSVIIAYMKLRKRNLGPILDANGWAINARARISVPFGATLSKVASLPPGSRRDIGDPYAEKVFPWKLVASLLLLVYLGFRWYTGSLNHFVPKPLRASTLLGKWAPAAPAVPVAPVVPSSPATRAPAGAATAPSAGNAPAVPVVPAASAAPEPAPDGGASPAAPSP